LFKTALAAALALLPVLAAAAGNRPAGDEQLSAAQYHAGLKTLRGYLEKRDLEPDAAERFIAVMATALPPSEGSRVPVTHDVFSSFMRYQAAWARKTRDSKNAKVTPAQLQDEVARAVRLKEEFRLKASVHSPVFYRVFQAAVREVRRSPRRDGKAYAGSSAVFFSDNVDPSYTHVDAGDVALENGDADGAIAEAGRALAINPGNADALVLRAGAEYERGDLPAAVADAQSALVLDPSNQQAKAILSLSGTDAARAALAKLSAGGTADAPAAPPSATPAVGALLSNDLTARAVGAAKADARSSIDELDRALTLNPRNASARGWRTAILNRIGEYAAALASAEQTLTGSPNDAPAYFHKAYALSGTGDKAGTVEALRQATRINPAYQPVLDKALQLPSPDDMALTFGQFAESHPQELPPSRRARFPAPLVLLGAVGVLLVLAGAAVLFRKGR
jgi:tetratricopeptide (TPR) repeat protein